MNIFRLYHQNRIAFWISISAIIVFVIVIHTINAIIANHEEQNIITIDEKQYENKIAIEEQISDEQVEEKEELVIDQFIKYCNAKNIQSAYSLLSDECKEEIFPTLEIFQKNYVTLNFDAQKLYSKERYSANTYQVTFYENMLNTGNVNTKSNQDYYTIVKQDGKSKLNISNYIGRQSINKKTENDKLQIQVIQKEIYMEYEIYEIKVTNLSQNTVVLDTKENTKTMYLTDKNNVKYYATSHEIIENSLYIKPMATNTIYIKYTKEYKSNSSRKLVFEDIVLDYIENTKAEEYKKVKIEVSI